MTISPTGENLIFLLSQPRAGSTLLQRILAGHPKIASTPEPWLALLPLSLRAAQVQHPGFKYQTGLNALEDFLGALPDAERAYRQACGAMAASLYNAACVAQEKPVFLDKTPLYYLIIPELLEIFPEARFIFLLRNPLAVLASILETWVKGEWYRLARHEKNLMLAPRRLVEGITALGEQAIVVRYEVLVSEPEREVARLCDCLGFTYSPDLLMYQDRSFQPGRMGDPTGVQRFSRPSPERLDRWLSLGKTAQYRHLAEAYLQALGPDLLQALGYPAEDLRARLQAVPLEKRQWPLTRWQTVFPSRPRFFHPLRLLLVEFLQRPHPIYFARQLARWLRGTL